MFTYLNKYIDEISVRHPHKARFMRYAFFGGLSTLLDLILFYVLIEFDVRIKVAIALSFAFGVLVHYVFVRTWVYTGPFYGNKTSRYINFIIVNTLGLLLTIILFRFFRHQFHPESKGMLLVIRALVALVVGVLSYLINTLHVFKQR